MKNNQWSLSFRYVVGIAVFVAVIALLIYAREAIKMLVVAAFVCRFDQPCRNDVVAKYKTVADSSG